VRERYGRPLAPVLGERLNAFAGVLKAGRPAGHRGEMHEQRKVSPHSLRRPVMCVREGPAAQTLRQAFLCSLLTAPSVVQSPFATVIDKRGKVSARQAMERRLRRCRSLAPTGTTDGTMEGGFSLFHTGRRDPVRVVIRFSGGRSFVATHSCTHLHTGPETKRLGRHTTTTRAASCARQNGVANDCRNDRCRKHGHFRGREVGRGTECFAGDEQ
jgi:hypothetical protein